MHYTMATSTDPQHPMRVTDEQFKKLLIGNYLGYQRGGGGAIPSDPEERIKQSKGLQAAYLVMVEGKGAAEAGRVIGLSRQSVSAMVTKLTEEYYGQDGMIDLKVRIPANMQERLAGFLEKIDGYEVI